MTKRQFFFPLLLVAIVAFIGILLSARWGMGLQPDSASYIGGARQIQAGDGLTMPGPNGGTAPYLYFAPLYPFMLAVSSLGSDPMQTSLWVNAALMAANVFLSGLLVYRATRSLWASLAGAVLIAAAPDVLRAHSVALTEPPFMFFCLLTWLLLAAYVEKPRPWLLIAFSLTTALAFLSRYSGAGLVAANALTLLLLSRKPLVRRMIDIVVMGIISSPLPLLFMTTQGEGAGGRSIAFHPIPMEKIVGGVFTVAQWFLPENVLRWLAEGVKVREPLAFVVAALLGVVGLALLAALVTGVRRANWSRVRTWLAGTHIIPLVLLIFCLTYFAFMIFSITFLDAYTWLESRIMLPSHIPLMIALTCIVWRLLQDVPRDVWQRRLLAAVAVLLVVSYGVQGVVQTATDYAAGVEFKGEYWRNSEALDYIEALPADTVVYSNNPEVIYLYTGRMTGRLPFTYDFTSLEPNPDLDAEIAAMAEQLEATHGYVVYFSDKLRDHVIPPDELAAQLNLTPVDVAVDDAAIYTP